MNEDSLQQSLDQSLASTDFDPEDLELADVLTGARCSAPDSPLGRTADPDAPATISTGLNSADLAYVYLSIEPAGEAVLAQEMEEMRLTHSVWGDLRPAEALELGRRLRVCARAAARFAEACGEPDEADGADDVAVSP